VHSIKVIDQINNETRIYPTVEEQKFSCDIAYLKSLSGIREIDNGQIVLSLKKMGISANVDPLEDSKLNVLVPITRPDVLHPCDIAEDLAIAYGYEKLKKRLPPNPTVGKQQ